MNRLKTMGILDWTITFSQMLEWTHQLAGIKDHSHTSAETMNAYGADYNKRKSVNSANFHRSKRLKWLKNRLDELNVELEFATNERAEALEYKIGETEAEMIALKTQTEENPAAANALKKKESAAANALKNEERATANAKRRHADSELIDIYRNNSSGLNPDEVMRAKELEKARDQKNEQEKNRYHAQRAAAKGMVRLWTCDVCKSCTFDTFEKAVAHESQCNA